MATTIVPPAGAADPSLSELRAMVATTNASDTTGAKPATSEPAAGDAPVEEHTETATEPVVEKPEPKESDDADIPEGVKKRIAKEAEKAARIQSEIDRAVSARKAKEAELQKLSTEDKGSAPVKTPQSSSEKPQRPQLGETGHETETWEQFQARESKYEEKRDEWLRSETKRELREEQQRETAQKTAKERWDAAVAKHGKEFPALMESARELAPEGLQVAISSLDGWDIVAVHLAKNPAKLQELAQAYAQNPTKAIATLGRIEASLITTESKTATEKPLPEPLKKVGGNASASGQDFQTSIENGSISQLRATVAKIRGKK